MTRWVIILSIAVCSLLCWLFVGSLMGPQETAETVLPTNTTLAVRSREGSFSDTALSPTRRHFSWRGREATDDLTSRGAKKRWYGAFGLFESDADLRGAGWAEVGNFEEAQRHYSDATDAIHWLEANRRSRGSSFLWTHDGLVAYFHEEFWPDNSSDPILEVWIYQICINGHRPSALPDSSDGAIHLNTAAGQPAQTYPCTNPGSVRNDLQDQPPVPAATGP